MEGDRGNLRGRCEAVENIRAVKPHRTATKGERARVAEVVVVMMMPSNAVSSSKAIPRHRFTDSVPGFVCSSR